MIHDFIIPLLLYDVCCLPCFYEQIEQFAFRSLRANRRPLSFILLLKFLLQLYQFFNSDIVSLSFSYVMKSPG